MQNWQQFLASIRNYLVGSDVPEDERYDYWQPLRASSVKHFCQPAQHDYTVLQRQIYIAEGSRAHRIAEAMKLAIQSSAAHYFIYKLRYDEYEKYNLLKKAASARNLKNQLAEDVHDYLLKEALDGAHQRLHKHIVKISPHFSDEITQGAIKKYLSKKVAWEVKHPGKAYEELFIAPGTAYARHKKEKAIAMPRFDNTIGKINIFRHPLIAIGYVIDTLRKIFLDYPARVICWAVRKLTFGSHVLLLFFNFILAGPFVLFNIIFFAMAKGFAGDRYTYVDASPYPPLLEKEIRVKKSSPKKSVKSGKIEHISKKYMSRTTSRSTRHK